MDRIADAASMLAAARLSGMPLSPLPVMLRPRDEAEAYWMQSAVHQLIARGRFGEIAGYAVACASPAAQRYLGVRRPCSGGLFAGTMHKTGSSLRHDQFQRPGVECGIAVKLGEDLAGPGGPFDAPTVVDAVDSYMPAVMIVDDRYEDWRRIDTATLIADDFFAAASVVGEPVSADEIGDPVCLGGTVRVNGQEAGYAHASELMGHPMNVLAWLANALVGRGDQLRAGDTVFLGGLFQTRWLNPNDAVSFEVKHLGKVEFALL